MVFFRKVLLELDFNDFTFFNDFTKCIFYMILDSSKHRSDSK